MKFKVKNVNNRAFNMPDLKDLQRVCSQWLVVAQDVLYACISHKYINLSSGTIWSAWSCGPQISIALPTWRHCSFSSIACRLCSCCCATSGSSYAWNDAGHPAIFWYSSTRCYHSLFVPHLFDSYCFPVVFAVQFYLNLCAWGLQWYFTVHCLTIGIVLCRAGTCWSAAGEPEEPRGSTLCC